MKNLPLKKQDSLFTQSKIKLNLLRNRHLGKRCFILGNGPSLLLSDIEKLCWEYTFASNKIYVVFNETMWRPTYYVVEDPLVLQQQIKEIQDLEGVTKFFPYKFLKFFTKPHSNIFYHVPKTEHIKELWKNKDFPLFSVDAEKQVYWGSTVVYTQIQLAVFMGFKEIYLLGVDHSYICPDNKVDNYYTHVGEKNHFHKDYRKIGEKWHQPQLDVLERSYARAYECCTRLGVKLYNASRHTCLDSIPRCSFDEIMK